jgi:hypothetical protein
MERWGNEDTRDSSKGKDPRAEKYLWIIEGRVDQESPEG